MCVDSLTRSQVSVDRSTKLPYEGRVVINDIGYNGLWFDHWPEPWNKGTSIPAVLVLASLVPCACTRVRARAFSCT